MAPPPASSVDATFTAPILSMQPLATPASDTATRFASSRSDLPRWKRTLDITCICLAIPALFLVVVFIAMLIKVVSPGPIFYRQERVGYRRTRFMCWKFRSMKVNADQATHRRHSLDQIQGNRPMTKLDSHGDSRLIPFGAILRASGLDELPQLINVWQGEMSLVGPRPCMIYELETYQPGQLARFETLPGITGLWQVSGKNRTTFNEMVDLDIRYARNRSLRFDLTIMAKTLGTVAEQVAQMSRRSTASDAVPAA